jgi:hypothetical protein
MAMTKQQIAEGIYDWFFVKGNPRSTKGSWCVYRGDTENHRCAVGCLLPNELYSPEMENLSIDDVCTKFPKVEEHFGSENTPFLGSCQYWHDSRSKWEIIGIFQDHGIDTSKMPLLTSDARWS